MLDMARDLIDPKTRQATAFYAALAVSLFDVIKRGFHPLNAAMLAAMAGITVLGALSMVLKPQEKK